MVCIPSKVAGLAIRRDAIRNTTCRSISHVPNSPQLGFFLCDVAAKDGDIPISLKFSLTLVNRVDNSKSVCKGVYRRH